MSNIVYPGKGSQVTQMAIFKQIWMVGNKRSFISDVFLRDYMNTDFFLNCFAHVLPKAQNKYPYFKYYAKNIVLLTPAEHTLWDYGTEEKRISHSLDVEEESKGKIRVNWDKLKDLERELKEEYKKYFPTTKHGIIGYKYSAEEQIAVISKLNKAYFSRFIKKK